MKPSENAALLNVPREVSVLSDDGYLVEMTDRLQRLRSLQTEQQEQQDDVAH